MLSDVNDIAADVLSIDHSNTSSSGGKYLAISARDVYDSDLAGTYWYYLIASFESVPPANPTGDEGYYWVKG